MENKTQSLKNDRSVYAIFSVVYMQGHPHSHLHLCIAKSLEEAFIKSERKIEETKGKADYIDHPLYSSLPIEEIEHNFNKHANKVAEEVIERIKPIEHTSALMKLVIDSKDTNLLNKVKPILNSFELKYIEDKIKT